MINNTVTDPVVDIKQELDYERHFKIESDQETFDDNEDDEEVDVYPVRKKMIANEVHSHFPTEDAYIYCEKCNLKMDGDCPVHGPHIYIDKAETEIELTSINETIRLEHNYTRHFKRESDQETFDDNEDDEEVDVYPVRKNMIANEVHSHFPTEDAYIYCEKCNLKMDGDCPVHGPHIYIDKAEMSFEINSTEELNTELINIDGFNRRGIEMDNTRQSNLCGEYELDYLIGGKSVKIMLDKSQKCNVLGGQSSDLDTEGSFCHVCGLQFADSEQLIIHKRIHAGKSYKCDVCGVHFCSNGSLAIHKRIHTGEKSDKCGADGVRFIQHESLKADKGIQTRGLFTCDVCGKSVSSNRYLTVHKRIHTGVKPYKCDVCSVRFIGHAGLRNHKRIHTGLRPFMCDVCGKTFTTNRNLMVHKRIHTGEKPYKCEVCSKSFNTNGSLVVHKRIHTEDKPYKCDVCGARFITHEDLKAHKRIHWRKTFQV